MEKDETRREKSKLNQFLKKLITVVNILFVLALLLSAWSQRISPETISWGHLMGLAFPILLIFNILWVLAWVLQVDIRFLLSTIAIIVCWGEVQIYCPINKSSDPSIYEQTPRNLKFKLLSYNVMGWDMNKKVNGHNESVDLIKDVDADIVCIQEFGYTNNENLLTTEEIHQQLSNYPYFKDNKDQDGLALYSKFPIIKSWYKQGKTTLTRINFSALKLGQDTLVVVNNHLVTTGLNVNYRVAFDSISHRKHIETDWVKITEVPKKLVQNSQLRAQQIDELYDEIVQLKKKYRYVVLCGDFNDSPISYTHYKLNQLLRDSYIDKGRGPGISYNKHRIWVRIDHIMPCNHMETTECDVIHRSKSSDHYPIYAKILLK